MSTALEIVKSYHQAFESKNIEKVKNLIHDDFSFNGPCMQFDNAESFLEKMTECGFKAQHKVVKTIATDDQVVVIFDWICEEPVQANIRMCECFQVRDGKIQSAELFFDSAKFPSMEHVSN